MSRTLTTAVLVLAFVARVAAAWHWSGHLDDDRDVYRALALGIVEGRGFSSPGTSSPTAYRPPLYPLLLAATGGANSTLPVAVLNILFGTLTVAFVLAAARQLQLGGRASLIAGLLTAIDPLLLYYTSFPMTETLCTCLLTAFLWSVLRMQSAGGFAQIRWGVVCGVLLGMTALCRPTVWACAILLVGWWIVQGVLLRSREHRDSAARREPRPPGGDVAAGVESVRFPSLVVLLMCAGLTVAPWAIRNGRVFGRTIVTTTHGGYTLLLGNNPAYYDEVVNQPLGVVWDGSRGAGQQAWAADLVGQTDAAGLHGEIERDRWMSQEAWRTICANPAMFVRACGRRFLHFWSIVPNVRSDASLPQFAVWSIGIYYAIVFASLAGGFARIALGHVDRRRWLIPALLIAGFCGVHLLYWSDARMRAPVMPEIALVAACGLSRKMERG